MWILFGARLRFNLEEIETLKEENSELRAEVAFLRELATNERDERVQLNERILEKTGFVSHTPTVNSSVSIKPIGQGISSFPRLKQKLEQLNRRAGTPVVEKSKDWQREVKESEEEVNKLIAAEEKKVG